MAKAVPVKGEVVIPPEQVSQGTVVMPWPAKLCCFDNCNICADLPLCCYAACCGPCLWAEISEHLDVPGMDDPECCPACLCCHSRRCSTNFLAFYGFSVATSVVQGAVSAVGLQNVSGLVNLVPCLTMKTRMALESNQGLEVQCKNAYCADFWCGASSYYQQAVYVKHVLKKDFQCVAYRDLQTCCCCGKNPSPGGMNYRDAPPPAGYSTITQQPSA